MAANIPDHGRSCVRLKTRRGAPSASLSAAGTSADHSVVFD